MIHLGRGRAARSGLAADRLRWGFGGGPCGLEGFGMRDRSPRGGLGRRSVAGPPPPPAAAAAAARPPPSLALLKARHGSTRFGGGTWLRLRLGCGDGLRRRRRGFHGQL